jgi:hypothetical protein
MPKRVLLVMYPTPPAAVVFRETMVLLVTEKP